MMSKGLAVRGAVLFAGSLLASTLVGNFGIDLRMWLQSRFGGVYGPMTAYYAVHYLLFQLTLIMLVYTVLYGLKLERAHEAVYVLVMTAGKLLGRASFEPLPSPYQLAFSIVISTQLSMTALLLGYRLHLTPSPKTKINDVSMETYAGLATMFWFTIMPGVDLLGSDMYSNLIRVALAFSLLAVSYVFFKRDEWIGSWLQRTVILIAFCTAGLLLASLFSDVVWVARTITVLSLTENLFYISAQILQAFFLSMATAAGIWLNLVVKKP